MTEEEIFEVEGEVSRIVLPDGTVKEIEGQITIEKLKEVAREVGVKRFTAETEDGVPLRGVDFPRTGTVVVREYNAAK